MLNSKYTILFLSLMGTPVEAYRYNKQWSHCKEPIKITGNQQITKDGAKKAADDAWAGNVRFKYGEIYMSLDNARFVEYICARSSIGEPGLSNLVQTLTRCEITAQPCRARREQ